MGEKVPIGNCVNFARKYVETVDNRVKGMLGELSTSG